MVNHNQIHEQYFILQLVELFYNENFNELKASKGNEDFEILLFKNMYFFIIILEMLIWNEFPLSTSHR